MSSEGVGEKRKRQTCAVVRNILDPIAEVIRDESLFLRVPLVRGDGSVDDSVQQLCSSKIGDYVKEYSRMFFPLSKETLPRWKEVPHRFSVLVLLSKQIPEFLEVVRENWVIVRKTLFFSANWFLASANICRKFPFKIYEIFMLTHDVTPSTRGSDHVRVPYQMTDGARSSVILFTLRMSFMICRVIHKTNDSFQDRSSLILDPLDMLEPNQAVAWSAAEMKTKVKIFVGAVEALHEAVQCWCLHLMKQKFFTLYGCRKDGQRKRLRAMALSDFLNCKDFAEPSAFGSFRDFLRSVCEVTKDSLIAYREQEGEDGKDVFVYNDFVSIMEESLRHFKDSFFASQSNISLSWNTTLLVGSVALAVLYPEQRKLEDCVTEDTEDVNARQETQASPFASPLLGSRDKLYSQFPGTLLYCYAFAGSIAVCLVRSERICQRHEIWKSTGEELSVYQSLKYGSSCKPDHYRIMWENLLLKDHYASVLSNAENFLHNGTNDAVACILMRVEALQGDGLRLFNHARRPDILHPSVQAAAMELIPCQLTLAVPCQCYLDHRRRIRVLDCIALRISVPNCEKRGGRMRTHGFCDVEIGGAVEDLGVSKDREKAVYFTSMVANRLPLASRLHDFADRWVGSREGIRKCSHPCRVLRVIGAVHTQHSETVFKFSQDLNTPNPAGRSTAQYKGEGRLCLMCAGITTARCLASVRVPESSVSLSQLVFRSSLAGGGVLHNEDGIIRRSTRNRYKNKVLACQVLLAFRKVNHAQWSVMYETLRCIMSNETGRSLPTIIVHGPPGTGKTTTIVNLLSLLYHDTPEYYVPSPTRKQRDPSFRTLICAASNAGIDEILSKWMREGAFKLNFLSLTGREDCASPSYFKHAMKKLHEQLLQGEARYSSLLESRALRPPQKEVEQLDEEESDLRILRVGATKHSIAGLFLAHKWTGTSQDFENDDEFAGVFVRSPIPEVVDAKEIVRKSDIVFSTCSAAGSKIMADAGLFGLIIIDEAGQATEPEALIPISKYLATTTVLLVIGDTRQLGPTILSQDRNVCTLLGTSFMERIQTRKGTDTISLLLNEQYRMHPIIAKFISDTFYAGALRSNPRCSERSLRILGNEVRAVCVDTSMFCASTESGSNLSSAANIISVRGMPHAFTERRQGSSYSNEGEAILIGRIVQHLLFENRTLQPKDIAVITPYSGQKNCITNFLYSIDMSYGNSISVDTIDSFQGKECPIVIIDLVRSGRGTIGFIGDERRANVSISRAMDLVIVIGNFNTIRDNPPNPWQHWFKYCEKLQPSGLICTKESLIELWRA